MLHACLVTCCTVAPVTVSKKTIPTDDGKKFDYLALVFGQLK